MVLIKRPVVSLTLAITWWILADSFTFPSFVGGLAAAWLALSLLPAPIVKIGRPANARGVGGFVRWFGKLLYLTGYFLWEVVLANIMVAKLVIRPQVALTPGIVAMQLKCTSAAQATILSSMITLTPGTISMELAEDLSVLYIHSIDGSDEEGTLAVPRKFERMIMEVIP